MKAILCSQPSSTWDAFPSLAGFCGFQEIFQAGRVDDVLTNSVLDFATLEILDHVSASERIAGLVPLQALLDDQP